VREGQILHQSQLPRNALGKPTGCRAKHPHGPRIERAPPDGSIQLEPGFTRGVSNIGHFGTGDLEITLSKPEDLERAMPLIKRSYENS
jgi:hypothetical protein